MTCAELRPHYAAYALGIADETERREIADHIKRRCVTCAAGVRNARRRSRTIAPWAISALLSFGLIAVGIAGRRAAADTTALQRAMPILRDPAAKDLAFGGVNGSARGRIVVSAADGVLLVASGLPHIDASKSFELWVLSSKGATSAGGTFTADKDGNAVLIRPGSVTGAGAIEVTVEPDGGSPQPTTSALIRVQL